MVTLAIIILITLALYVLGCCVTKRAPTMLSEVYYITDKDWLFPALMATLGASFLPLMLETDGLECMAFLTCAGIIFVGAAPAYLDEGERTIHKCGAITSAIASVAWACSIDALPTVLFGILAGVLCIWKRRYWLFIAECCAILNIVVTLFFKS